MLRLVSGITGGITGTLALFIVFFLLNPIIPSAGETQGISVFVIIILAFVGTITANSVTALMVTFLDNEKYTRRKTIFTQVFLFNLILFILTIPLYVLGISLNILNGIVALHFLLSAYVSALIMEVLAGYEYSLVGIYSASLGIFISIVFAFIMIVMGFPPQTLYFLAMPGVWLIIELTSGFVELAYDNFTRYYGVDALNVQTDIGGDTREEDTDTDDSDEEDTEDINDSEDSDEEDGSY